MSAPQSLPYPGEETQAQAPFLLTLSSGPHRADTPHSLFLSEHSLKAECRCCFESFIFLRIPSRVEALHISKPHEVTDDVCHSLQAEDVKWKVGVAFLHVQ